MLTGQLEAVSEFDPCSVLESTPTRIAAGSTVTSVGLFDAFTVSATAADERTYLRDVVLNSGGLCTALDWCPGRKPCGREYLAVSCHPKGAEGHYIGSVTSGVGLLQLWTIETLLQSELHPARMALGMLHDGALCSFLQWCPNPSTLMEGLRLSSPSIGLLAAALGNGEVQVLPVPQPSEERRFLRVEPWISLSPEALSGSPVSCLDWHPSQPHDLLLLGCWDGTVSLWALPLGERDNAQQLLHHSVDSLALRRVLWIKPPVSSAGVRDFFCSVGHNGHFTIWDRRNMFQPVLDWTLTRWWLMDADISADPLSVYIALEDASIRQLPLEMTGFTDQLDQPLFHVYSGQNKGAIHSICCSPCNALVAYGGEDGEIAVFAKENVGDTRYRKPHVCAGAMQFNKESRILHVISASEFRKIGGMYIGGTKFSPQKPKTQPPTPIPDSAFEYNTIQCLRFSPNGDQTTWLAAGCVQGLVRLIRITE